MKRLFPSFAALLLLSACSGGETPAAETGTHSSGPIIIELGPDGGEGAAPLSGTATADLRMKGGKFSDERVIFPKGAEATLRITAIEGSYGVSAGDLGINLSVVAGQTVEVAVPTDKPGEFELACGVGCGEGESATIVIEE